MKSALADLFQAAMWPADDLLGGLAWWRKLRGGRWERWKIMAQDGGGWMWVRLR